MKKAFTASVLALGVLLTAGVAGAQTDPVATKIQDVSSQFQGYAVPLLAGVAAIVGVFVAIPLVKKFARMLRNAIG